AEPGPVGPAQRAELDRELHFVAAAFDGAADQELVVPHAVEVAGVEEGDAPLDRALDGGDALVLVGLAVHAGQAHAAERDAEDGGPVLAELDGGGLVHDGMAPSFG